MILVFGGAYQGKLDYVKENFDIETVCDCTDGSEPDFSADVIYGIEGFVMKCARQNAESEDQADRADAAQPDYQEAKDWFAKRKAEWSGSGESCNESGAESGEKILIMTDTSQGVVPIDKTVRAFREMNGRLMLYLAREARQVVRVFCGIGKVMK